MKNTEKLFWQWLHENLPGHHQRIENAIDRGTPDANICYGGKDIWLELKCAPFSNVQMSSEQRVWAMRRVINGGNVILLSRWEKQIAVWMWKHHLTITVESLPDRQLRLVSPPHKIRCMTDFNITDLFAV
jgi:hypothetical protein